MKLTLPHNYAPRDYQLPVWEAYERGVKRILLVWHRRAGKEKTCLNIMVSASQERIGLYAYVFPTFGQGKKVIWDGMDREGFRFLHHFPRELWEGTPNSTEMKLKLKNGSMFQVLGTERLDNLMGMNPVGIVFSEYALQDPQAWDYLRPILAENGGWAIFNGTPRGRNNHLHRMWQMARKNKQWFSGLLTVEDTQAITQADIQDERDAGMSHEMVQQEFYCNWEGALTGSYYVKQMEAAEKEGRVCDVPYDPSSPVDTWWDLGIGDSTCIVFTQSSFNQIRVIDYYEHSGEAISHYIHHLDSLPYVYGEHVGPHDLMARQMGTGKTLLETAGQLGVRFRVARKLSVDDGIGAVRMMLPLCWFDRSKCSRLIDALLAYHREWDSKKRCFNDRPDHDWSSHPCDAIRMGAVGRRRAVLPQKDERYQLRPWQRRSHGGRTWMST